MTAGPGLWRHTGIVDGPHPLRGVAQPITFSVRPRGGQSSRKVRGRELCVGTSCYTLRNEHGQCAATIRAPGLGDPPKRGAGAPPGSDRAPPGPPTRPLTAGRLSGVRGEGRGDAAAGPGARTSTVLARPNCPACSGADPCLPSGTPGAVGRRFGTVSRSPAQL